MVIRSGCWSGPESVALAAMQMSLMQSDIDATKPDEPLVIGHAVLGDAVAGIRTVAAEERSDRPFRD